MPGPVTRSAPETQFVNDGPFALVEGRIVVELEQVTTTTIDAASVAFFDDPSLSVRGVSVSR